MLFWNLCSILYSSSLMVQADYQFFRPKNATYVLQVFVKIEAKEINGNSEHLDRENERKRLSLQLSFYTFCRDHVLDVPHAVHLFLYFGYFSLDRKSTRLNSSHGYISYAVFCLKKKKNSCLPFKSK